MTPIGAHTKKTTQITVAGRRLKRWIAGSLASTLRKHRQLPRRREAASNTTISSPSLVSVPLSELKDAVKATQTDQVIHDVFLPSETIEKVFHNSVSSGSSSSSSSSSALADGESESGFTSPDEGYQEPPSLPNRCDGCKSELAEKGDCPCTPVIAVVPPSPPCTLSPTPSTSPRDDVSSVDASDEDQIPDEEGFQVEITQAKQEIGHQHTEDARPDEPSHSPVPWDQAQEWENQWKDCDLVVTWTELQHLSSSPTTCTPPPLDEPEEASTTLLSSDGRMTLTLRNFLGAGSYGKVVSADWAEGRRQVAIKVSHKLFISELDCTESGLRTLKNELEVLKALKESREDNCLGSNFFPELFKSWQDAKNVYFAMDIYPWNLEDLRWANPTWDVTTGDKILWAAEMILGVQALHRMRILHRDIKPANIFVTSSKHIIIGDYGLAHAWLDPFYADFPSTSLKVHDAPGTMCYLAPEVVKGFYVDPVNVEVRKYASYSFEADIWSLGVTICDSWSRGTGLFHLREGEDHLDFKSVIPPRILQMDVEPVVKQIVDEHPIWHLITRMLDRNPRSRIGFNEILAHPVFALLDLNRVANLQYSPMWTFPERDSSRQSKPVKDAIEFASYYRPPEEISSDEEDSERTRADKLARRNGQILRRAMGDVRDWMCEQQTWLPDETFREYDFDWTASEVIAEEERWDDDDD